MAPYSPIYEMEDETSTYSYQHPQCNNKSIHYILVPELSLFTNNEDHTGADMFDEGYHEFYRPEDIAELEH